MAEQLCGSRRAYSDASRPACDLAVINGGIMSEHLIHTKVEPPTIRRHRRELRGQKPPLKVKEIWAIRIRLQLEERIRDLAMFNLAIDSKLRACDLTALKGRRRRDDRPYQVQSHCDPKENWATGPVRNHRAEEGYCCSLNRYGRTSSRRRSGSEVPQTASAAGRQKYLRAHGQDRARTGRALMCDESRGTAIGCD
jgi:hypothetical protein